MANSSNSGNLRVFLDISREMNSKIALDEILPVIVKITKDYVGAERVSVFLLEKGRLALKAWAGFNPQLPVMVNIGEGVAGAVAETGEGIIVNNGKMVSSDNTYTASSYISLPIVSSDKVAGVINITDKQNDHFNQEDLDVAQYIAYQCALAVERFTLYNKQRLADRMQLIGTLRAAIAHDIRNLLGIVEFYLTFLEDNPEPESIPEYCAAIRTEVQHVQGLTTDIMEYSKQEIDLRYRDFDLSELCNTLVNQLNLSLKYSDIKVFCDVPETFIINADPERLYRTIFNLANNAIQAVGDKGAVLVRAKRLKYGVGISIADNGMGIPKDKVRTIFDPFVTSGKPKGTGLGLAIVQEVVRAHGGKIYVRSKVGRYTLFYIRIPITN